MRRYSIEDEQRIRLQARVRGWGKAGLVDEIDVPAGFESGGGRPRFYRITTAGRRLCADEAERLARFVETARARRLIKRRV